MRLDDLLKGVTNTRINGDPLLEITGISYDSRRVKPGDLFVALKGHKQNGHEYLQDAVSNGAVALVAEKFEGLNTEVTKVAVSDTRAALSKLAAQYYRHPYRGMNLIGITGTNGKTSTSYILASILEAAGVRAGVIGTISYRFSGQAYPAPVTTPESLDLMGYLREMANAGITDVIMEVSSHALDQGRTAECPFKVAVFTNFSRDHLDYHGTLERYFEAKSRLFRTLKRSDMDREVSAVINLDDPRGSELIDLAAVRVVTYGLDRAATVRAERVSSDRNGLKATLVLPEGEVSVMSPLLGHFNIYNILAAAATALCLGIRGDRIIEGVTKLRRIPGRLERVENDRGLTLVVDYAHSPDALLKTFKAVGSVTEGRLITVFGCGGDRDQGKRFEMGFLAGQMSDVVFVTSDNPRSEDPLGIIAQIERGIMQTSMDRFQWPPEWDLPPEGERKIVSGYFIQPDRREAIRMAVRLADEKDVVLIAGKGHENYQIIGDQVRHFDDREEAAKAASDIP